VKLTAATVEKLKLPPGVADKIFFDDDLSGFGLRLREGGKRTWIAQYRVGTKQRRVTLGTVENLDAAPARRRAKDMLSKVHLGGDPQTEKAEARAEAAFTLASVADAYLTRYAEKKLKASTLDDVRRYLKRHWAPLSKLPVRKITRADVAARLGAIAEESGGYAANRARAALNALYAWAIGEGLADLNPVVGANKPVDEKPRDRVLTAAELAAIWNAAGEGDFGAIVRLLTRTGQRREEAAAMTWDEVDLDAATWRIGGDRTKNKRPHDVPLSAQALDILRGRERRDGRALVFGSRKGPFSGWSKAKAALDGRIEAALGRAPAPWRLHDIRRTVATGMADLGVQPHVIEAVLNHISGHKAGVAGVYNRATYAAEKRQALDMWAAHVDSLAEGGESNIVPLRAAR
jgi:integrase